MKQKEKIVVNRKPRKKAKKGSSLPFSWGQVNPEHGRILVLMVSIIFVMTFMLMQRTLHPNVATKNESKTIEIKKETALEKEIKEMVEGYPIEKMTPYILEQNPKTAMFMIAIAKKESAWGKRKPVLAGQDCYNYWGFRLKAEKMGSGGHTCFDSPKEAVSVIASRIDELVNIEKIDTPKEMVVWKCGYNCQDREKNESEIKWIKDVDYYYSKMLN